MTHRHAGIEFHCIDMDRSYRQSGKSLDHLREGIKDIVVEAVKTLVSSLSEDEILEMTRFNTRVSVDFYRATELQ